MYELTNPEAIKYLCKKYGFTFSKGMGQNFIINPEVPYAMSESVCESAEGIIEIGAGFGTLTASLASKAKKVVAIELDTRLEPVLQETLAGYDNVKIIWADAMKTDLKRLIEEEFPNMKVSVAANLPYYITTPMIMYLLESRIPFEKITVMIQKEVAERLNSDEKGKDYGAISVSVRYFSEPKILMNVSAKDFIPIPKVDSCVIEMTLLKKPRVEVYDEKMFFKVVKASFAQRRKTLKNGLANSNLFDSESINKAIEMLQRGDKIRGEALSIDEFAKLSNFLSKK